MDGALAIVGPPGGAELRGQAEVAVVQAADFWKLHDLARRGELDGPELGCILVEREVCARLMVIGEVAGQDAAQVSVAKDEHVIQTFASDGTDQAGLMGGRPPVVRPESRVQYSRKRRRCHLRTVAGVTITRGCVHPAQTLASATQESRSVRRSGGRVTVLYRRRVAGARPGS
jgi:hypothetical protein